MTVKDLFIKGNKFFLENNFFGGIDVYKEIWFQFPKNKRLEEEINKNLKKFKKPILQTHSKIEIENFFYLEKLGKSSIVIKKLSDILEKMVNESLIREDKDVFTENLNDLLIVDDDPDVLDNYKTIFDQDQLNISCSDASLPGSRLATSEILTFVNDGITIKGSIAVIDNGIASVSHQNVIKNKRLATIQASYETVFG